MLVELPILAWLAESPGVTAIEMLVRLKATPAGPGSGSQCALDSLLEGGGFEPSVPRVMDGDLGRQVPARIAVFELAGTAVALQRGTKVVWPHRHPEFP
jgi:hypothetical protein